ncbi:MAG: hypothetical protein AAF727_11450, partial [Pseudomonadota bacterium]
KAKKDACRAEYDAKFSRGGSETQVKYHEDHDYVAEIRLRKKSRNYDRQKFAAELAQLVDEYRPELIHAGADQPLVKDIEDTFAQFASDIAAAPEDDIVEAMFQLADILELMKVESARLREQVMAISEEAPLEDEEGIDDSPVVLWSIDLGGALTTAMGKGFDYLSIAPAPISVTIPKSLMDAFNEVGDLMTPAQIQHEASSIAQDGLRRAKWLATDITKEEAFLLEHVNASRRAGEPDFADEDDANDWIDLRLEEYVRDTVNPEVAEMAEDIASRVETLARDHATRAAAIRSHLHKRKRKIARKAVAPVIGVVAGGAGILIGTGLIALAPASGGISAVGGVGIALASVAALRASVSGFKLLHDELRSISSLTKSLHKDANSLLKSYEKGKVSAKEVRSAVVNSILVAPIFKSYPRLREKFDTIERRIAKSTQRQIELTAEIGNLLDRIEADRKALPEYGVPPADIDRVMKPFEDAVQGLIDDVHKIGDKLSTGIKGESFTTVYSRAKTLLDRIGGMIGSKTALATAIIPVVTEFTFLIANASVGCAGVFEATGTLAQAVNGAVVIGGEIGDGIGAIDAV